ncbi:MAG: AAA family ATPase [Gammaproteobacteria bacterium]
MADKLHNQLITALLNKAAYDHETDKIELLETHISWVLLTGKYAYKIKKPVNLGFLDFSTLKKRHFYCNEELRLNSQLAPQLYLNVVTINGTKQQPQINGEGKIIEYAVKMHQFPQHAQFDRLLSQNLLNNTHMDKLAITIAKFHETAKVANKQSDYGNPELILTPVNENFNQIKQIPNFNYDAGKLQKLQNWSNDFCHSHENLFFNRKNNNFIRECHGDMHLRNIAYWKNKIVIFDCLEFDNKLRWIDTISEIAFIIMDLDERNHHELARRFLNAYLEQTGDYSSIPLLRFYLIYRAIVRAKINAIQSQQIQENNLLKQELIKGFKSHIDLALNYCNTKQPNLIIMHGLSGTGKTTLSQKLLEKKSIIRLRSDVERKRLFGLDSISNKHSIIGDNLYTEIATEKTYQHLFNLAKPLLQDNWSVLIDATFLNEKYRQQALQVAKQNKAKFIILDCLANKDKLHHRVEKRQILNNDASDANLSVLENQIKQYQPLTNKELKYTFRINTENAFKNMHLVI